MQATPSTQAVRPNVHTAFHDEATSLLHSGHQRDIEADQASAPAADAFTFLNHVSCVTHASGNSPVAHNHARHFWQIDTAQSDGPRSYKPGIADSIRLDAMVYSGDSLLICYGLAGFMDAMFPHGATIFNPSGSRHEVAAIACLVGTYVAYRTIAPVAAGLVWGALVVGCNSVGEKMSAHPLSTRMAGYATSAALSLGAIGGAAALYKNLDPDMGAHGPKQAHGATIYGTASVAALLAGVPALAATGWYLGRIGSAALRRS